MNETTKTASVANLLNELSTLTPTTSLPTLQSSLSDLTDFIKPRLERSAAEAWEIGYALKLAKSKVKKNKQRWLDYLKIELKIGERTAQRYMAVADLPRDAVKGEKLARVYEILAGPETPRPARRKGNEGKGNEGNEGTSSTATSSTTPAGSTATSSTDSTATSSTDSTATSSTDSTVTPAGTTATTPATTANEPGTQTKSAIGWMPKKFWTKNDKLVFALEVFTDLVAHKEEWAEEIKANREALATLTLELLKPDLLKI